MNIEELDTESLREDNERLRSIVRNQDQAIKRMEQEIQIVVEFSNVAEKTANAYRELYKKSKQDVVYMDYIGREEFEALKCQQVNLVGQLSSEIKAVASAVKVFAEVVNEDVG